VYSVIDSIPVTIELYNDSGSLWEGEQPEITVTNIRDFNDRPVDGVQMTDNGDGTYSYTIAAGDLTEDEDYEIRIDAASPANNARNFRIIEISPGPSIELIPIASPTTDQRPDFSWYTFPGASTYTIEIDTDPTFNTPLITTPTSDTTYTPLVDLPAGTIYWQVTSDNNPSPSVDSFVIQDADIPIIIAYTPDPTKETRPTLVWHAVSGASSYDIIIDDDPDPANPIVSESVSDTFYTPTADLPTGTIYWRVRSDLSNTYSEVDDFTILSDSIPLLYTFDGDSVADPRPIFRWEPVNNATYYRIQISTDPQFRGSTIRTPTSDTTYTPLIDLAEDTYYWRVSSDLDLALYSEVDSLMIVAGPGVEGKISKLSAPYLSVHPNPFKSVVYIHHNIAGNVELSVYDISGKLVKRLQQPLWTGKGSTGMPVASGKYYIAVKSKKQTLLKEVNVVR
jgi:hypothetical protein